MWSLRKTFTLPSNLVHITSALSMQRFSNGLVGVFIPLVILQSGGTLLLIAGFYLLRAVVKLLVNYPAIVFIQRRGAHAALGASFVFGALQLVSILGYANTRGPVFLVAGAVSFALSEALSDNSRHIYISHAMDLKTKSSSMATMEIFGQGADFLGPLIGLLIGSVLGTNWLLITSLITTLGTFIPLREMGKLPIINQSEKLRYTLKGAPWRDLVADFCFVSDEAVGRFLWPIYLAVVLGTFSAVGGIASLSVLVTIITVWIAGRRGDKGHDRSVLRQGITAMSLVDFSRLIVTTAFPVTLISALYNASESYTLNGVNSIYYARAKRKGLQYIVSIEIACDVAYTAVWSVLFLTLAVSHNQRAFFVTGFLIAAVTVWGTLYYASPQEA